MIYELLDTGKENALSTEYLKQALGFRDVRSLRKQVETERLNGKIIISSSGGGYYKPSSILYRRRRQCRTMNRFSKNVV